MTKTKKAKLVQVTDPREKEMERAKGQAKAQYESIKDMVERLQHCDECDGGEECELSKETIYSYAGYYFDPLSPKHTPEELEEMKEQAHDRESAERRIQEDPLSVQVRSDWHNPGSGENDPVEFTILLCTGGPACRIIGTLDQYNEPDSARIEYQDWFTPWVEYRLNSEEEETVLTYCRQFYFGE